MICRKENRNYYRSLSAQVRSTILKNVPVWSPNEAKGDVKVEDPEGEMTLAKFDVKNLLDNEQFLITHRRLSMIRSPPLRF